MESEDEQTTTLRDIRDIKGKIKLEKCSRGSCIIAVAIDTVDLENNLLRNISTRRGDPINSVVYDVTKDVYCVNCVDYYCVGDIPVSYKLKVDSSLGWEFFAPLPESVFKRHLTNEARENLENWKLKYKKDKYNIRYLQITRVYINV